VSTTAIEPQSEKNPITNKKKNRNFKKSQKNPRTTEALIAIDAPKKHNKKKKKKRKKKKNRC
jgi:hypothetical protein